MSTSAESTDAVTRDLVRILGREHVLTERADREFYAMDVYGALELPLAVVRPATTPDLQAVVRLAVNRGLALVTRGGSASYTAAHLPSTPHSLLIDTSRLNRILEINDCDMYVTVEPGVTWHDLWQTLKARGLRTSFWGPFSGLVSTVGGSTSQNSASFGSGTYGTLSDAVLGFEVVLANGELLRTGSHAAANGKPFFRWYGPDLTGLFCGDSGALGIKAAITLRLITNPPVFGAASFGFDTFESLAEGMAAAARVNVASDNFGLDPKLQQGQMGNVSAKDAIASAIEVTKASRNPLEALGRLARMAVAGRRFLAGSPYSAHFTAEGTSRAEVNAKLGALRDAIGNRGRETANTIPTVIRAMPFVPPSVMLGPRGERWAPQHGLMPLSATGEFHARISQLYQSNAEQMARTKVAKGAMFMTIATHAFLYEPVFYWEDELTPFHRRYLSPEFLKTLPVYPPNPDARELVRELRVEIQRIFTAVGAIHLQVGKCYPYMDGRQTEAARAVREIKNLLDPNRMMNPGALGL